MFNYDCLIAKDLDGICQKGLYSWSVKFCSSKAEVLQSLARRQGFIYIEEMALVFPARRNEAK